MRSNAGVANRQGGPVNTLAWPGVLHTQCMYVLCMDVRTNSGYLCIVNLLVLMTDRESVYWAVRAECLNTVQVNSRS